MRSNTDAVNEGSGVQQQVMPVPKELTRLFDTYLSALADPGGGARLLALLAPGAIVRAGPELRPAAQVDPGEFARSHAELSQAGRSALPVFASPEPVDAIAFAAGPQSVGWFEVHEQRHARRVTVGVGFEATSEGARIGWCIVTRRAEPWTYRRGYVRALSHYAWMSAEEPARPRGLLDASYFRAYPERTVRFGTLEDARFGCHMSTVCCRNDFEITLDPAAQMIIDAIPWSELGPPPADTKLPVRPDGRLQLKRGSEPCRFIGARGQCLVHQFVGIQPFATCAIYPFSFAQTPEEIVVAMSPVCPSARQARGAPLLQDCADLLDRLAQATPRRTDVYRLAPGEGVDWERFRDLERALLACLGTQPLPMRQRLYLGTRILGAVRSGQPLRPADWLAERPEPITPELRAALRGMLERVLGWDRPALRALPRSVPEQLPTLEIADPAMLSGILQNMLYAKGYSYPYDLTTAFNFGIVLYLVALLMQAAARGPLSEAQWQELGALGVHGLLKDLLHEGAPEGFRALFGTVEFGQWLLMV